MQRIDIITLFPSLFTEHLNNLPFKRAISKNLLQVNLWDLRKYAIDSYGSVDGTTYGGGTGMILRIEPIYNCLTDILGKNFENNMQNNGKIILLTPRGKTFTQATARELVEIERITFICGRYEGVDARVEQYLTTDVISIGDYVVSGGELPTLSIMESVTRLIPGILEKSDATTIESFSTLGNTDDSTFIEYPQYTKPDEFMGHKVPDILLSGNHKKIEKWRKDNARLH